MADAEIPKMGRDEALHGLSEESSAPFPFRQVSHLEPASHGLSPTHVIYEFAEEGEG